MLIRSAEVDGCGRCDVRLAGAAIDEVAPKLAPREGEPRLDAAGGALLPGLHDHHLHLFALAAEAGSLRCGPPEVRDAAGLARALADAPGDGAWIRGTGYHESVAGELDRHRLDAIAAERPVRIQHRGGALWMLNSAAARRLGLDAAGDLPGLERDAAGRATGRLFRLDAWLRERLRGGSDGGPPSLAAASGRLAARGVTGVTDAGVDNDAAALGHLVAAVERDELRQQLLVMGAAELPEPGHPRVARGPLKLLLDERALPDFDSLRERIAAAHADGRAAAIHCVTRAELVLALGAFEAAGPRRGDRIEHAGVAPPETAASLARLGLTVVTQPNFVRERGDAWLVDVDPRDRPWLYRGHGLEAAGVPLGGGTDAPFGRPDPWTAMAAAVDRRTAGGEVVGAAEALTPERALALFTTPAQSPGGPPRRVAAGEPADLCLLEQPWSEVRGDLAAARVAAAFCGGRRV